MNQNKEIPNNQKTAEAVHDIIKASIFACLDIEEVNEEYIKLKHKIYKKIDLKKIEDKLYEK